MVNRLALTKVLRSEFMKQMIKDELRFIRFIIENSSNAITSRFSGLPYSRVSNKRARTRYLI